MAIKTENIVYNIQTTVNELSDALTDNSKKVAALDTDIKDAEKTASVAFSKMGQSAKAYGEKIQEAERNQKRLSNTIKEQEQITQEFQRELLLVQERLRGVGRNTVEFQRLTKEADRLKNAIKDNNVALQSLRIDKRNIDQSVNELKRLEQAADKAGKEVKGAGGGIGDFGNALGTLSPQIGGAASQFEGLISSLGRLGPGGIAAAGGIAALAGGFLLAKNRIEEFDDQVEVAFNNFSLGVDRAGDSFATAFAGLFNAAPERELDTFGKKVSNFFSEIDKGFTQLDFAIFGEDITRGVAAFIGGPEELKRVDAIIAQEKEAVKTRTALTKAEQEFEDVEIRNIETRAKLRREIANARADFEEARTEGLQNQNNLNKAQEAYNRLVKGQATLTTLEKNELAEKLRITEELNKLTLSRFDTNGKIEAQLRAQLEDIGAQEDEQRRTQQRLLRQLKANTNEQVGEINRLEAEIKKLEDAIKSALNEEDRKKYNTQLIATRAELQKIIDSLEVKPQLGIFEQVDAELQRLQGLLRKAGSEDEAIAIIARIVGEEELQKDYQNWVNELKRRFTDPEGFKLESAPLEFAPSFGATDTEFKNTVSDLIKKTQKNLKDAKEKEELEIIGKQQIEDEAKKALQVYAELSRDILRQDIERTDRQIELQRERVSEFQKIAENGNAEQLQLEEERLKELLEKRERYAQRERAISALLVAAANAEAIASGISAVAKGFSGPGAPFTGIANAIALAATIGSTIVALRNATSSIPAFAEGTEYVHRNGAPKGKDTIFARLNEGERVLTTEQNAKLKGISNSKLVEIASEYQLNNMRMKNIWTAGKREDNTDLIRGINRTNKLLEGLNLYADVNEYGLQMGISRAERSMNRRRNLAR